MQTLDALCPFETWSAVMVDTVMVLSLGLNWLRSFVAAGVVDDDRLPKVLVLENILEV